MLVGTEVTLVDGLTVRLVSSDSGLRAIDFEPWAVRQGWVRAVGFAATSAVRLALSRPGCA